MLEKGQNFDVARERILRVYDHIQKNIGGDITIDRLSDVACLSPFHFHRQYRNLVGESLIASARRCRLYLAGKLLTSTTHSIAHIARTCGYTRTDSFSRAFQRFYGVSALSYRDFHSQQYHLIQRAVGNSTQAKIDVNGKPVFQRALRCVNAAIYNQYQVELIELPETSFVGIDNDPTQSALEPKFVELNLLAQSVNLDLSKRHFFGLFHRTISSGPLPQFVNQADMAATPISYQERDLLERQETLPFTIYSTPKGTYASYLYQGPYSLSERSHQWLFGYWLPRSGLRAEPSPIIEQYLNDPRVIGPSQLTTRILVNVEPM